MKTLLIHAEDDPEIGPWAAQAWDRIVDLGLGGLNQYARWSNRFRCPVTTLNSLRHGFEDFRRVRDLLSVGCGRMIDEHGLDWWEIMSIRLTGEMETLILLQRLVQTFVPDDEVYISRPGLHASFLLCLLTTDLKIFPLRRGADKKRLGHYFRLSNQLSAPQMLDVLCDKYDAGYQFRGRLTKKRKPLTRPVILLPTAYVNVSRIGIAYADTFSEENFLLVTTRRSGWVHDVPKNVNMAWLSSYASVRDRDDETREVERQWQMLTRELTERPEFDILSRTGYLDGFPGHFHRGLEIRDAWLNVLHTEPVQAVLCADDSNPYTGIPLRLARNRGVPNISCHHGALDGRYVFKRICADVIWAKGKMEEDYLVRKCGVPRERVEIVGPASRAPRTGLKHRSSFRPYILFISEASDGSGGRPEGFYRDVLPSLAELARATGRKLIVKLHPAESQRERTAVVARVLSSDQKSAVKIVSGPLTDELLVSSWFAVTILSTVALECAIREIPCFLCKWLEFASYGYIEQFIRFGVATGLDHPGEIKRIPEYLRQHSWTAEVRENCWQPAPRTRLRELIASKTPCNALAS